METLKKLVRRLEGEADLQKQVAILQEIGEKLVSKYVLSIGDLLVVPLWVEAYYFDRETFEDPFTHRSEDQKGAEHFGKLYFHQKTDSQRGGVDLCLSLGDYYLSFLLKYTLVNGVFTSQGRLSGKLRTAYEASEESEILQKENQQVELIGYTTRVGLTADGEKDGEKRRTKEKYKPLELAVVRDFHRNYSSERRLPGSERLMKQYLNRNCGENKEKKAELFRRYFGYCPSEYK